MTAWYEHAFGREYLALYPHRDDTEAERDVRSIIDLIVPNKDEPLLDLGCGAGRHLVALHRAGSRGNATSTPRRARRTRRILEARDAFGPSILVMPVCRVGTGRRASVIIKIVSPIRLCVARRQVI